MKVTHAVISNVTYDQLYRLLHEELSAVQCDMQNIDEAFFCLEIRRQLTLGKKRIVIDVKYPK